MKNKDALAEAKKKVDNLSYIIGEILEGKLSQSKAAEQLKISPQTFGKQISQYFAPYVKSKIISEEEIKKMIHDLSTPIERMTEDIFDLHENERILMLDDEVQEKVIEAAKERLNEREYRVMDKRYGLSNNVPGEKGLTLEIVGKEFGVCRDRISQIQSKSLRKMRTPQIWKEVLPEYQELVEALEDLETMQEKRNKVIRDYENVLSQIRWIQYQEKVYELFQEWSEFEKTKLSAVFTIESIPWLPEKLEKAFSLHGIHTIKDLISISEETVSAICRDTETPMPDFIKLCNKTGIFPIFYNREPFPNEFDMPIEYLDLSVRSYNCLHRAGIYTVNDIIKRKGKIKDIRNLGKKSYKEIVTVIWEKYSINLDHVE